MKRTIIILITVVTLCAAGVLYGNHGQPDQGRAVSLEEAYTAQFPEQLPDVVIEPMNSFTIY